MKLPPVFPPALPPAPVLLPPDPPCGEVEDVCEPQAATDSTNKMLVTPTHDLFIAQVPCR
jgi:hypothetical protein